MEQVTGRNKESKKTSLVEKLCCPTGNIIVDVIGQIALSFLLIFTIKVARLSGQQTGLLLLVAQLTECFFCPVIGYCSDKVALPWLASCVGRRKAWHLLGTILAAVSFSIMFTPCLICNHDSSDALKVVYYALILVLLDIALPTVDISHLSIISLVAKTQEECITLTVLRTFFTYAGGICAYGISCILLGQISADGITENSWKEFTIINCSLAGIGLLFTGVIFHLGTTEPKRIEGKKKITDAVTKTGIQSVAIIFNVGAIVEEETGKEGNTSEARKLSRTEKITAAVRKVSTYLVPFETTDDRGRVKEDSSEEEQQESPMAHTNLAVDHAVITSYEEKDYYHTNKAFEQDDCPENQGAPGDMKGNNKKSSLPGKIVKACHIVELEEAEKRSKTKLEWFKDPTLYTVSVIFALTRLMRDAGYSYMSLYLTDYLLLPAQAIAYYPLIMLTSGIIGTVIAKLLNGKLGSKWTYCLAAAMIIGSSVCFFFVTPEMNKAVTYVPTVFMGIGISTSFVMALAFITRMIGDNKEAAGFVFSLASSLSKLSSGVFFMGIQRFYPDSGATGKFARYVFTFSIGIIAALGFFITIFSQKSGRLKPTGEPTRRYGRSERHSHVQWQLELPEPSEPQNKLDTWDTRL